MSSVVRLWLDGAFELSQRGTDVGTEMRAGTVAFLSSSYLLLLVPQLLSASSSPSSSASRWCGGVALSSAVGCALSGWLTNFPVVLAPGLGLTTFFAAAVAVSGVELGLSCAFVAAALLVVVSFLSVDRLTRWLIPRSVKVGAMAGLGLLVGLAGLRMAGVVRVRAGAGGEGFEAAELRWEQQGLAGIGLVVVALLLHLQVRGAMLFSLAMVSAAYYLLQRQLPHLPAAQLPELHPHLLHLHALLPLLASLPLLLSLFIVALLDVTAVLHSVASMCPLPSTRERLLFLVTGLSSMAAAVLGCPPLIVAVESIAGVKEGGRTGLTAITAAALFLLSLALAPLFALVPPQATAPLLLLIGAFLFSEIRRVSLPHHRLQPVCSNPRTADFLSRLVEELTGCAAACAL